MTTVKYNLILIYNPDSISEQLTAALTHIATKTSSIFLPVTQVGIEKEVIFNIYLAEVNITMDRIKTVEVCLYQCYYLFYEWLEKHYGGDTLEWTRGLLQVNLNVLLWKLQSKKIRYDIQQDVAHLGISNEACKGSSLC
jgi:hypothetical protein